MRTAFLKHITDTLHEIDSAGLFKRERQIVSAQSGRIVVLLDGRLHDRVVNRGWTDWHHGGGGGKTYRRAPCGYHRHQSGQTGSGSQGQ